MKSLINAAILLVFLPPVIANAIDRTSIAEKNKTYVVNLEFCRSCLSEEEAGYKYSYKEVNTYAELKHDPRRDLPVAFTICSSVMTTYGTTKILFNILGKDGNSWLEPLLAVHSLKTAFYHVKWLQVKLPPVQMACNSLSLTRLHGQTEKCSGTIEISTTEM